MRAVVQRVSQAVVTVDDAEVGRIGAGLLVLVGVAAGDGERDAVALVDKLLGLRVFPDEDGRMDRSVLDVVGGVLVVSQFTLLADIKKGRRPSFVAAADPAVAEPLVARIVDLIGERGVPTASGRFGALMDVTLSNHGPVTLVIDIADGVVQ